MTIDNKLGKVKTELDLDVLISIYYELDELYIKNSANWDIREKLNRILLKMEMATGYEYFRTLKKKFEAKKSDQQK